MSSVITVRGKQYEVLQPNAEGGIGWITKNVTEGSFAGKWSGYSPERILQKYLAPDYGDPILREYTPPPPPPAPKPAPRPAAPPPLAPPPTAPAVDATREAAKSAVGKQSTLLTQVAPPSRARTKSRQKAAIQRSQMGLSSTTKQTLLGTA